MAKFLKGQVVYKKNGEGYRFLGGDYKDPNNWELVDSKARDFARDAGDVAASAVSGVTEGLRSLGKGAKDLVVGAAGPVGGPAMAMLANKVAWNPRKYEPQTPVGRYAQQGVSGATQGVAFGPMGAVSGATGALGGEAGSDLTGGSALGRLAGGLIGGMAPNVWGALRSDAASRLKSATEGVTPDDWARGQASQAAAAQAGVPVTGPEAMGNRPLLEVQRQVENLPQSAPIMARFMAGRPEQTSAAIQGKLAAMGQPSADPRILGANIQKQAQSAIERGRAGAEAMAKPAYKDAASQGKAVLAGEPKELVRDPLVQKALDVVLNDPVYKFPKDTPRYSQEALDMAAKWIKGQEDNILANPQRSGEAYQLGSYADSRKAILKEIEAQAPSYATARNLYSRFTDKFVTPKRQGTIGALAATDDPVQQVGILTDPKRSNPQTIKGALADLKPTGTGNVRSLVRDNLESIFSKARQESGVMSGTKEYGQQFAGAKFAFELRKDPAIRQNYESLISNTYGEEAAKGFNTLLDVLEATGKRMPAGSKTSFNMAQKEALTSGIAQKAIESPSKLGLQSLNDFMLRRSARQLAETFTSPDSVTKMRELAYLKPQSARARILVGSIIGMQEKEQ